MSVKSETGKWMALTAALLGWMFDGAEMGLFSMVGRSAMKDLMGSAANEGQIGFYFGVIIAMFLVGAATGGVLFGWLGDRIGRVRAMSLSVITYALFTGLCGFATQAWQLALLRFIAALGMGGEWSLGVALVMEVWPNRSRALMAGLIGAAANFGYLLVGLVGMVMNSVLGQIESSLLSLGFSTATVQTLVANQGWRILMMLGAAPAVLTFFFRLFVPESEKWQHEHGKGTTSHWATQDLFGVLIGAIGPALIVAVWALDVAHLPAGFGVTGLFLLRLVVSVLGIAIATWGYLYPVRRYLHRLGVTDPTAVAQTGSIIRRMMLAAGLSGVALMGTWGSTQWAPAWANQMTSAKAPATTEKAPADETKAEKPVAVVAAKPSGAKEWAQVSLAIGAIIGTIAAALMGDLLGRRATYALFCVLSLISVLGLFQLNTEYDTTFLIWCFIAGTCTASFYGWLPLYLPELFGTRVRATGQGFGFNFGRIIAAVGALQTGALTGMFKEEISYMGLTFRPGYPGACSVMSLIYVVGLLVILFAPETKGQPLPE